jgi:non-homologous end joining protein Ku
VNVRDGMEDYDYLVLAHAVNEKLTRTVLRRVSDGACASCAERNVTAIRRAREALAAIIEKSVPL